MYVNGTPVFLEVFHTITPKFKQALKTGFWLWVLYIEVHFKYIYLLYNYNFLTYRSYHCA